MRHERDGENGATTADQPSDKPTMLPERTESTAVAAIMGYPP